MSELLSTEVVPGADRLELEDAELRVVTGPDKGAAIELGAQTVLIGSGRDCDLVLHDQTVSARHAELSIGERYVVRDLGSTNGVFVDRVRVDRAPLGDRMRIRLGDSVLELRRRGERRSIPLAAGGTFGGLVTRSVRMRALQTTLEQLAASDATVLIEGETGTGKEVAARALHASGARARGPFVVFDCGAAQRQLAAAELFGYEKGAFTGALASRAGLFEEADGGTLFLDELGELPLDLQPLLLGAIERRESRRVGGQKAISHDVRVIAATNRNLAEEVSAKRFREDLFYRVAVARVRLPPLRERTEDLPALARAIALDLGAAHLPLDELLASFIAYRWPGNVRELRNTIQRVAAAPQHSASFASAESAFFDASGALRPLPDARARAGDEFERLYLEKALALADGRVYKAAELAGVSRRFVRRLVTKHGLRGKDDE